MFFYEFIWCANQLDRLDHERKGSLQRRIDRLQTGLQMAAWTGYAVMLVWALSNA